MNFAQTMAALEAAGTEQNVKIYRKHGADGPLFGVSSANLGTLRKKIKTDHTLAEQLWASGNVDARILATMIADPAKLTRTTAARWATDLDYHLRADYLAALVARTPFARELMIGFMAAPDEYLRQCGYAMLAALLKDGSDQISDGDCRAWLAVIAKEIHASPNRARYSMNNAVIAIGIYRPALTVAALETSAQIGAVEVDHGDTACRTPDAAAYIRKALDRKPKVRS